MAQRTAGRRGVGWNLRLFGLLLAFSVAGCDKKEPPTEPADAAPHAGAPQAAASGAPPPHSAATAEAAPEKPQQIQEAFSAWKLVCAPSAAKQEDCIVSQAQTDSITGQNFSVALSPSAAGELRVSVVTPLGMSFQAGTLFQIDASPPIGPLKFETCMQDGCLVPARMSSQSVAALKGAKVFRIGGNRIDGTPFFLSLSLDGLAAGLSRAATLSSAGK